uniref:50S ribosomal protein L14 n=1 Tax=Cyanidiococcus yangmingshanensis TaxID=2690220 RepID=A0A7H0WBF7_9RHOD|nr:50S ribosomal protein L14 [Cyanidiococcus yangmingshanensis]UNJ18936.1 ribosomal protein L14 [Cyanidioschyzonaceae sp. 2 FvB-2021]
MIYVGTNLKVFDNSGVKSVKCIRILGSNNPKFAGIGDLIVVSVKNVINSSPNFKTSVKKGSIYYALVVQTKKKKRSFDNFLTSFINNGVVILDNKKNLLFTRIKGPISYVLRVKKFTKVLSLSKYIL